MSLVQITADFSLLCKILTRIADALDRAVPPLRIPHDRKPIQPEDIVVFDTEKAWQEQQEAKALAFQQSQK